MKELEKSAYGTTTLGHLIAVLEQADSDADVEFDFCYLRPTNVASYRGYYSHLALGWSNEPLRSKNGEFVRHWPSVANVLTHLKSARGKNFDGWKGGTYRMDGETPIWVANPGETGGTGIVGIDVSNSIVVLITTKVE
jgi:hypothetical protein